MPSQVVQDLLYEFYQHSYSHVLGLKPPPSAFSHKHFQHWATVQMDENQWQDITQRINTYQQQHAPYLKTELLLHFLKTSGLPLKSYLDFGCGTGTIARFLITQIPSLRRVVGVDIDSSVLPSFSQIGCVTTDWITDVSYISPQERYDLLTIIHTLHHVGRSIRPMLAQLSLRLRSGGFLYLVEDSWGDQVGLHEANIFDARFNAFPVELKQEVFQINDEISNNWFYERNLDVGHCWYRSLEEWTNLLDECGLVLVEHKVSGFKINRLHGIPAVEIIARRR